MVTPLGNKKKKTEKLLWRFHIWLPYIATIKGCNMEKGKRMEKEDKK